MPDLSIVLCLRDDEAHLPSMARSARAVTETLAAELSAGDWRDRTRPQHTQTREEASQARDPGFGFELLALDEGSRDNTLSVLSILHAKVPELRSMQELARGSAIRQAARTATGRVWLIVDAPFEPEHGLWAARQVFCGDPAAIVPGEVLAVSRNVGQAALGWLSGGLVSAQREVQRMLTKHGQGTAWSPPTQRRIRDRTRLFVRARMGGLGLGRFDRK